MPNWRVPSGNMYWSVLMVKDRLLTLATRAGAEYTGMVRELSHEFVTLETEQGDRVLEVAKVVKVKTE